MSTFTPTNESEVAGTHATVIHVDESYDEVNAVYTYTRTALALTTKDDLSIAVEDDEEEFNPSREWTTRRYRTGKTVDFEVSSPISVSTEAAELIGLVDANGKHVDDPAQRRIETGPDPDNETWIELAYSHGEISDVANAELVHRFDDLELVNPEIDPSETPPLMAWTWWVEGDVHWNYTPPA